MYVYMYVCMYVCLPNITNPMYVEQQREMIPPPSQNNVAVCKQITLLILYYIRFKLVTRLKIIDDPVQVCDSFLSGCLFQLINFNFQMFIHFFLEMSISFTSYIV